MTGTYGDDFHPQPLVTSAAFKSLELSDTPLWYLLLEIFGRQSSHLWEGLRLRPLQASSHEHLARAKLSKHLTLAAGQHASRNLSDKRLGLPCLSSLDRDLRCAFYEAYLKDL